jgi:zinc protease
MPWIVVTGDVDADEVAAAAAALPMPGGASDVVAESPEWPLQRVESSAALDRAQTGIAIGMAGPARQDDDRYALSLAGAALSGLGGRVFEELRSRRSLAYTVSLRTMARREAGAFVGYLATSPDREDEARTELLAEIARVATHGVEETDLERARRYAVGTWDIRRQTTAAVASDLVGALVLGQGLHELREYRDRILAVTGDSVRKAARRWLDPDRAAFGVVRGRA